MAYSPIRIGRKAHLIPSCKHRRKSVVQHTVGIWQIERMLLGARRQGLDMDRILRLAGIPKVLLGSPIARVSQAQCAALIRVLMRVLRDEFWGLCNHRVRIGTFAEACRVMVDCKTLGDALRAGLRYYHMMLDDFVARLHVDGGVAAIVLVDRRRWDERHSYAHSAFLFWCTGLMSWLAARRVPLRQVRLRNVKTSYNTDTCRMFESEVLYGESRAGLSFDSKWLELPVIQNQHTLASFLKSVPSSLLVKFRDQTSATERTRLLLQRHIGSLVLTLDEVSAMLAMTPQTLRRRLHKEGCGFQGIKDDLRRDMSIEYLASTDLPLLVIAEKVGFSETSAFHRAFKSWTGVAPGEYRRAAKEDTARQPASEVGEIRAQPPDHAGLLEQS